MAIGIFTHNFGAFWNWEEFVVNGGSNGRVDNLDWGTVNRKKRNAKTEQVDVVVVGVNFVDRGFVVDVGGRDEDEEFLVLNGGGVVGGSGDMGIFMDSN
jgi:hypothetical protein